MTDNMVVTYVQEKSRGESTFGLWSIGFYSVRNPYRVLWHGEMFDTLDEAQAVASVNLDMFSARLFAKPKRQRRVLPYIHYD